MLEPISEATQKKFATIYAEAVLTFLDSGEAQWVLWDRAHDYFDFASVELDQPSLPVMLFVDASWPQLCEVDAVTDPDSEKYDAEALRRAIETELLDEGIAERALKTYSERLEKLEEVADEEVPSSAPTDSDET